MTKKPPAKATKFRKDAAGSFSTTRERLRAAWAGAKVAMGDASSLRPPVDPKQNFVEEFAVTFDIDVPPEVVAFYGVHDGEHAGRADVCAPRRLLSVGEITDATFAEMQRRQKAVAQSQTRKARALTRKVDPQCAAHGAYLLVITEVDEDGGFVALDFEPSESGTSGQVVEHTRKAIRFLAPGIAEWLESIAA